MVEPSLQAAASAPAANKRLLIVDDEFAIVEALESILENRGYSVIASTDYRSLEALYDPEAHLPDVILTDVCLGGANGSQIAKRLKELPHTRHIPVLLMSAQPPDDAAVAASGATAFFAKPFHIEALLTVVAGTI